MPSNVYISLVDKNELKKAAETRQELNRVSKSFCTVKWKHATINLGSGSVKSCCHLPFQKMEIGNLQNGLQLHDTALDRFERLQMLKGERPKDCSYCWWLEDGNHLSDRITWSSKPWMRPFFRDLEQKRIDQADPPAWLELNFSNLCNFKCSYCSPIFSSSWQKEVTELGPYPTLVPHNDLNYLSGLNLENDYDRENAEAIFWPWFKSIYSNLRLLKITGGEPLLNKNTFAILKYIIENPNLKLTLSINSNLCAPEPQWQEFVNLLTEIRKNKKVRHLYLHPSIDSYGTRAEYIRYGLDFSLFKKHVDDYLEKTTGQLIFISTINNLALAGLKDFWSWLLDLKKKYGSRGQWVSVTSEVLISPQWQNINLLPFEFQNYLKEVLSFIRQDLGNQLTSFSDFEYQGLERALEMMKKPNENLNTEMINFYRFFSEHDRRRKTDFKKTFPELVEFFGHCQKLDSEKNLMVMIE